MGRHRRARAPYVGRLVAEDAIPTPREVLLAREERGRQRKRAQARRRKAVA